VETLETIDLVKAVLVIVAGAIGTFLLLPHRHGLVKPKIAHYLGGGLVALSILAYALLWRPPGDMVASFFFYVFGIAAIAGATLTITSKNPVYGALWFASVIIATSGLFMLSGAQFLAAGTVIVYAGAIIVTFLFVIMLAQIEKQATYDRASRSPGRATFSAYLMLWSLVYALLSLQSSYKSDQSVVLEKRLVRGWNLLNYHNVREAASPVSATQKDPNTGKQTLIAAGNGQRTPNARLFEARQKAMPKTALLPELEEGPSLGRHVAGLGGTLFTDHLITVELAGALLFVALVGALAIASPKPPVRPSNAPVDPSTLV
jgi:NADH-quinone oxidoreductase subunit J